MRHPTRDNQLGKGGIHFCHKVTGLIKTVHLSLHTQAVGSCHCDADGELCKQEVPVLHQPVNVLLAKGHLEADHYQFTVQPFLPFHHCYLYKQAELAMQG